MDFCCEPLIIAVERKEIVYDKQSGAFWFYFKREFENSYGLHYLGFCPYCGAKLPKSRTSCDEHGESIYIKEIEKTLGKDYCDITDDEIPEEFKTDEWWIKRGL